MLHFFRVSKDVRDKGAREVEEGRRAGVSKFSVEKFLSRSAEEFHRGFF